MANSPETVKNTETKPNTPKIVDSERPKPQVTEVIINKINDRIKQATTESPRKSELPYAALGEIRSFV